MKSIRNKAPAKDFPYSVFHKPVVAPHSSWEEKRMAWLKEVAPVSQAVPDKSIKPWPQDSKLTQEMAEIMKSRTPPYAWFDSYYPLEDVIDKYMELWDEEATA